ncbi:MAG: PAS domain-containing protein [Alphaproteobacteria bacterium]|nr:PAS domain-containing protein [Rhodospirillales bacterium]MCW9046425.1 PAS domain-containing protein [Alphaproteobacteria bacterium]
MLKKELSSRKRLFVVLLIMGLVALAVAMLSGRALYLTAVDGQRLWLQKMVQSQVQMIEAIARHNIEHTHGKSFESARSESIELVLDAYKKNAAFGKSGEFVVAEQIEDMIKFLGAGRHQVDDLPKPVPLKSGFAVPMDLALQGQSGTTIGPDYDGVVVLAAHQPLNILNIGLVAKIDLEEIQAPFIKVGLVIGVGSFFIVLLGGILMHRVSAPIIKQLESSNEGLSNAQKIAHLGDWVWEIETGELRWSDEVFRIFGFKPQEFKATYQAFTASIHPDDQNKVSNAISKSLEEGREYSIEHRIRTPNGEERVVYEQGSAVFDPSGKPIRMVGTVLDITKRKETEKKLETRSTALKRSNKDLERFAYVASHDLQEPLRAVASYTQLLARRYSGKLDEKADKYIRHANEGALRMQRLIEGLLVFSRINTRGEEFTLVDCNIVVQKAIENLQVAITEAKAEVVVGELPALVADEDQLIQVFQNLISNALKFCSESPPYIKLTAKRDKDQWLIAVTDNGIGIDPEFAERIFIIFQRLHIRSEYPGEGLGLSICKQIIERHGGQIWLEPPSNKGTTFIIQLPASV